MRYSDIGGAARALWIALVVVVVTVGGLGWYVSSLFDPDNLKPRLVEAVRRATGRTMVVSGPIGVKISTTPTITLDGVTLSNPPGFSRPDMIKAGRVELGLALPPLLEHRLEISRILISQPEIQLETGPDGQGNWLFSSAPPPAGRADAPPARTPPGANSGDYAISIAGIRVEGARVEWPDRATGRSHAVTIPVLTLEAPDGAPVTGGGTLELDGRRAAIDLKAGSLAQMRAATETAAWPVKLQVTFADAAVTLEGKIARPLEGRGVAVDVDANLPDPSLVSFWYPAVPLTALRNAAVHAELRDAEGSGLMIPVLRVRIGGADLSRFAAGTRLEDATLTARRGAPMMLSGRLTAPGFDAGFSGTAGDQAWLMGGASGPLDIDLEANVASARATLKGRVAAPARFSGYDFDLAMTVPTPGLLVENVPKALKAIDLRTRVTDAPGPVVFRITSSAGDLAGEVEVTARPRMAVSGFVVSKRLDLDVLLSGPAGDGPGRSASGRASPASNGGTARPVAPSGKSDPVFSGMKLPFDLARYADANLVAQFGVVHLAGTDVAGIDTTLILKDGVARLAPFTVTAPEQRLSGSLEVDAASSPAAVHLTLQAPALSVRPVLTMMGLPPAVGGAVEVRADLTARGDTPHDLAASLSGWTGLALKDGQLDAKVVNGWLEQLRPLRIEGGDSTELRCFAVRMDAKAGVVAVQPLAFNTAALIVDGGGEVDLGHETLALRLRPRTRIGGTGLAVPLRVAGPLRAPATKVDLSASGPAGAAGLLLGGKDIMGAAGGGDPCPVALARARDVDAPPEVVTPTPPARPATTAPTVPETAVDVLRSLLTTPEVKK